MEMTGAKILLESLKREGVELMFGYPGGAILHVYDELYRHPEIKHVLVRHEQGAVHAADGYARVTGTVHMAGTDLPLKPRSGEAFAYEPHTLFPALFPKGLAAHPHHRVIAPPR